MPSLFDVKSLRPDSYYHVFTHALGSERCFRDDRDRQAFIESLRERVVPGLAANRRKSIQSFEDKVDVVSHGLMGNHLHFVLYQGEDRTAISSMMNGLLSSYAGHFNLRHHRTGALFEKPFHVRHLRNADDVMNEIAYVHNNPRNPELIAARTSHLAYTGEKSMDFIATNHGMRFFGNPEGYARFFSNYVDLKATRDTARRNIPV